MPEGAYEILGRRDEALAGLISVGAARRRAARADAQAGSLDAERDRAALGRLAATADVG